MRILLTNDDGINAPGLATLTQIANEIAGPDGEVWTVAPAFEQSGVAHCISYTRPFLTAKLGPRRFSAEGSPADCVLVGIHDVMKDTPPDLVLSGVNRGNNSGENALYSGTLGGALEAALQGIRAIALSQFLGPRNWEQPDPFEAAARHGADTIRRILAVTPPDEPGYRLFWNVNFPPVPASEVKGVRIARQGFREGVRFAAEPQIAPGGKRFIWIRGGDQHKSALPGTDVAENLEGHISVTPMRADLTAFDVLSDLQERF